MESSKVTLDRCPACGSLVPRGRACAKCKLGQPLVQPFAGAARGRRRLPVWLQVSAIAILVMVLAGGATTVWILHHSHSVPQSTASNQQSILSLGELPSVLPQSEEATLLLALVSREPGKSLYEISYQADGATVTFAYDAAGDDLVEVQHQADGHGEKTEWTGSSVDRLQGAAAGATLSATPDGLVEPQTSSF